MKVLTLKQPYASLILKKYKTVEIRSWKTSYRGEFYIHVSKNSDKENLNKYKDIIDKDLYLGKIILKCNLIDCIKLNKEYIDNYNKNSKYYKIDYKNIDKYGFVLDNIEKIEQVDAKGKLSFWEY